MQIELDGLTLEFSDCMEVGQGGPEACSLAVNGNAIVGEKFDPSPLLYEGKILIPMRKIGFWKSGYVLTRLDPSSLTLERISRVHEYMRLVRRRERSVEFVTTAWGTGTAFLPLP
ncbi:hypothetical protein [Novosphingobium sp. PASSN1]|uniref:hypothetical protein n=1 Tax=Novosphingobium sp. PASSN1 TaxID=2015561 RepID=UPI0025FA1DE9|nr:hypothetical protein [Novosphingobium sp. PASSN1]